MSTTEDHSHPSGAVQQAPGLWRTELATYVIERESRFSRWSSDPSSPVRPPLPAAVQQHGQIPGGARQHAAGEIRQVFERGS